MQVGTTATTRIAGVAIAAAAAAAVHTDARVIRGGRSTAAAAAGRVLRRDVMTEIIG